MTSNHGRGPAKESKDLSANRSEGEGLSLQDGMRNLEMIVRRLEEGECTLEESLDIFEEGTKLAVVCAKKLQSAQGRIDRLVKEQEGVFRLISEEFETGDNHSCE